VPAVEYEVRRMATFFMELGCPTLSAEDEEYRHVGDGFYKPRWRMSEAEQEACSFGRFADDICGAIIEDALGEGAGTEDWIIHGGVTVTIDLDACPWDPDSVAEAMGVLKDMVDRGETLETGGRLPGWVNRDRLRPDYWDPVEYKPRFIVPDKVRAALKPKG
jgi:hypothetical protein